jgi:phosphoribosyl-AMP cyclohydrolase / phosphoribosyl-ATP pyrophosphohydrolase
VRDRSSPLTEAEISDLDWNKTGGLIPAIVQNRLSGEVLMLAYMNREALSATLATGFATFFSRSKQRQWQKGETSGNRMRVVGVFTDCDADTLLVVADPEGPACHLGTRSCFEANLAGPGWLAELSAIVAARAASRDESSYTHRLLDSGLPRIAQKIGEEGVELSLAAISRDPSGCAEETADLLYHLAVLMQAKGFSWTDVIDVLKRRHAAASSSTASS